MEISACISIQEPYLISKIRYSFTLDLLIKILENHVISHAHTIWHIIYTQDDIIKKVYFKSSPQKFSYFFVLDFFLRVDHIKEKYNTSENF